MSLYQKLMSSVIFLLLCSLSMMIGHGSGLGLLGLFVIPLLAILCTLIVKGVIEEIYNAQHHHF